MIGTINKQLSDWVLIWERTLDYMGAAITINHNFSQYEWVGIQYTYNLSASGSTAVRYWTEIPVAQNTEAMPYLWCVSNAYVTEGETANNIAVRRIDLQPNYIKFSTGLRKNADDNTTVAPEVATACGPISIWGR